jgi:alanine racemase
VTELEGRAVANSQTATSTGLITIDLAALAANWRALAALVAPAECGAVVKADAYGLGAAHVIPVLATAGCRTFFIATPAEAHEARKLAPDARIFALDGLVSGAADDLLAAGAIPVLSSMPEVHEWVALAAERRKRLAAAIHIDSGLNRLGLAAREVQELARDAKALSRIEIALVMSHLASADDPADSKNEQQRKIFDKLRGILPKAPASLAASDGLMLGRAYHLDLVRPGYALYGGQAWRGGETPVRPVVRVQARILQVRDVAPGETVGYSATWMAARMSHIAVVAAGYADGFFRSGSAPGAHAGAVVGIGGRLAPVVGRVSMDLITVDVTDIAPLPQRGDLVDVVGPGLTIEAMGHRAGTIGYEVLTSLSRRFERVYV